MRLRFPSYVLMSLPGVPILMFVAPWTFNRFPIAVTVAIVSVVVVGWAVLFFRAVGALRMRSKLKKLIERE